MPRERLVRFPRESGQTMSSVTQSSPAILQATMSQLLGSVKTHVCVPKSRSDTNVSFLFKDATGKRTSASVSIYLFRAMVRLQEIHSGSSYKFSFKNRENLSLVFGHFYSAIVNDLTMSFTSSLKMDARCANQQ